MFNADFYPTPASLIEKMIAGINGAETILDLGAGTGNIAEYLAGKFGRREYRYTPETIKQRLGKIDVVEIEPDLQMILKGKGLNLIHDDILTFNTWKSYDLVIANFPFSIGDKCTLRALDLVERNGGKLRCLVNAETLLNTYSEDRKLLVRKLTEMKAKVDFFSQEFTEAERKTNVRVALISVDVERKLTSITLEKMQKAENKTYTVDDSTALAHSGLLENLLEGFNMEARLGVAFIEEYFAIKPYFSSQIKNSDKPYQYSHDIIRLETRGGDKQDWHENKNVSSAVNDFLFCVRQKYWSSLVKDERFSNSFTSNILKDLETKLTELGNVDFTEFNINQLQEELQSRAAQGIEEAILKMFDEFTHKYHYCPETGKNAHLYNGWKTNVAHRINKKIILPINGINTGYSVVKFDYYVRERIADICKTFNYLSKDRINPLQLAGNATKLAEANQDFNIDLRWISVKFYKKGTAHITFLDMELLERFNIWGSQRKGWLPPSYGKARYEDMSPEEQDTINTFQGRAKYEEVCLDKAYYLGNPSQNLLAE